MDEGNNLSGVQISYGPKGDPSFLVGKNSGYELRALDGNQKIVSYLRFNPELDFVKKIIDGKIIIPISLWLGVTNDVRLIQLLKNKTVVKNYPYDNHANLETVHRDKLFKTAFPQIIKSKKE